MCRPELALLLCAALSLGACGTSSDDAVPSGAAGEDAGGSENDGDGATSSPDGAGGPEDDLTDPDVFIGGGRDSDDGAGDDGPGDDPERGVLEPGVAGNVEASRLVSGMSRVLEATLVDLNANLRGGVLSTQQQECLGAYEPTLGVPALSLECARPLSTDGVAVHVRSGAFLPTEACAADLAVGTADRCVMASAVMLLRGQFAIVPGGHLQQPLPGTGVVVAYAPGARPVLSLENDDSGVFGLLDCEFELQNGALLPSIGGVDGCQGLVRDVADRIELMLPPLP